MKTIHKYLLMIVAIMIATVSCRDESLNPAPDWNKNVGAYTIVNANPNQSFFDLTQPLAGQFVEFTIDVDGYGITKVNSIDIELVFTEKDRLYDPFQMIPIDSVYDPIILQSVATFPTTIQISTEDIADALGLASVDEIELGDNFNLTFPIHTADGRRLTVALNSDLCNQPGQPSFGGCNVAWLATCPSSLAGNYTATLVASNIAASNFKTPQDITITQVAPAFYQVSDGTMDIFGPDFPIGMRFTDVCNTLTVQAASVNFPTLVIFDQAGGTTIDPVTGVITFDIVYNSGSCCGLPGIAYTFTATPK